MPLLDHFRPPIYMRRHWESFHSTWAVAIVASLNRLLPRRYLAEAQIHLGSKVEADVAEWDDGFSQEDSDSNGSNGVGGLAIQAQPYAAPPVTMRLPGVFPDDIEVQVLDTIYGRTLIAVIELASPGNKDRPESRRAFAAKCSAYLERGVGVVVVDIVTSKRYNLHNEFVTLLGQDSNNQMSPEDEMYAVSYRAARRDDENQIDVWTFPLTVGEPLPIVPLALRATTTVPLDLESTYSEARRNSRLD